MGESLNDLAKVLGIGGASTLCRVTGSKMLEEGDEEGYKDFKRAYGRSRFWPKAKSPKRKTAKAKTKTAKAKTKTTKTKTKTTKKLLGAIPSTRRKHDHSSTGPKSV